MVYVTRRFEFSASHRYWRNEWSIAENERVFGKSISPYGHGHNYTLDVTIKGKANPTTGMVMNITELKAIVEEILEEFDHQFLNEGTPYFKDCIPTTENIVRVFWRLITAKLPTTITLSHLRLYETSDLWADYAGEDETVRFARSYLFAAAHRLHAPALSDEQNRAIYGKCNNPQGHGHNYTVEVTVQGPVDAETGMVIDLETMDRKVYSVLERLDHRHLDEEIDAFCEQPSTGEHIILYLWNELSPLFGEYLAHLKLWETKKNIFEYCGEY